MFISKLKQSTQLQTITQINVTLTATRLVFSFRLIDSKLCVTIRIVCKNLYSTKQESRIYYMVMLSS